MVGREITDLLKYGETNASPKTLFSLGSAGTVVWWDIGANFLNYLSICTASSDDPLRAHRNRVKLILERNFVLFYY